MASYSIEFTATAEKQIRRIAAGDRVRVLRAIQQLSHDPRPRGCRKLQGYDDVFRVRAGTFRVIYSIEARRLLIIILKVGHRKDVYR